MPGKILIVDDDIDSLKLIGLMLQRNGYEVAAATTGAQALSKAMSESPDLIILDVMMPDMNGFDVCRRLRSNLDTQAIPIIMFTAKTMIDDKVAGFEAGADDYLTKPTHPSELATRIQNVLARSSTKATPTTSKGTTVGVLGAKGGVGTTTIAANLAAARFAAGDKALVADFRLGAGALGLMLGFGRSQGMANLLTRSIEEINARLVEAELVVHGSGLRALLCSSRPKETQLNMSLETAAAIVRIIRSVARPAFYDLGSGLTPQALRLQREMDQLLLVVDPTNLSMTMAREILQELDAQRMDYNKVGVVVVNRSTSTNLASWRDVEQILGRDVRGAIALASDLMAQSLNNNIPAVAHQPTAIASTQMIKLAEDVVARLRVTGELHAN